LPENSARAQCGVLQPLWREAVLARVPLSGRHEPLLQSEGTTVTRGAERWPYRRTVCSKRTAERGDSMIQSPAFLVSSRLIMRVLLALFVLLSLPAHADGFLSRLRQKPGAGGVEVLDQGDRRSPPPVGHPDKPERVVREDHRRPAHVVRWPLKPPARRQTLLQGGKPRAFAGEERNYGHQHLTLQNRQ